MNEFLISSETHQEYHKNSQVWNEIEYNTNLSLGGVSELVSAYQIIHPGKISFLDMLVVPEPIKFLS
ncbi:hypothetical protein KKG31_07870 [Patescibacteria group bacterium]|nr:hypothetical protein [Patescibacteria group bacterium]MBU1758983.1 hypothetical protein [Patescibacteria group bacterium]